MKKHVKKKTLLVTGLLLLSSNLAHGQSYNVNSYNYARYNQRTYNINYDFYDRETNSNYNYNWQVITLPSKNKDKVQQSPVVPESKPVVPEEKPITPEENPVSPEVIEKPEVEKPVDENFDTNIENSNLSSMEKEVVRLVNIERKKAGLKAFTVSNELSNVARIKSQDMAVNRYFSHTSPTYGSPFEMMKSFGIKYSTAGENIAKGYLSAQSVVNGWMNSSGHRANILNGSFNKIGVGAYTASNNTTYWTQMFTN